MACMLTGAIINTILDPVFIFVCHWGIKGAAWATVLGQVVSGVMILVYFWKFSKMKLTRQQLMPKARYLGEIVALGLASGINQVAMAIIQITMNNILRKYGAVSDYGADIPIACAGIISKVNMIFMSIGIGISQAVSRSSDLITERRNSAECGKHTKRRRWQLLLPVSYFLPASRSSHDRSFSVRWRK